MLISPLATFMKVARSSIGISRDLANRSASCLDGRRSPASIFRKAGKEHPERWAKPTWVRSSIFRRCLIHPPKYVGELVRSIPLCPDLRIGKTHGSEHNRSLSSALSFDYSYANCSIFWVSIGSPMLPQNLLHSYLIKPLGKSPFKTQYPV